MMHIGLFGGTFNPVHTGHLRVALEVSETFNLDKLWLIPAAIPPHKESSELVDASDRFEMMRLALAGNTGFELSDVELKRSGPSYTIDTIKQFLDRALDTTEFYMIVGIDAFLEIDTWKSYQDLFQLISFIVMSRPDKWPGNWSDGPTDQSNQVALYLKQKISDGYTCGGSQTGVCFRHPVKRPVYFTEVTRIDITSSLIRRLRRQNRAVTYLVSREVENYILEKGLYQ